MKNGDSADVLDEIWLTLSGEVSPGGSVTALLIIARGIAPGGRFQRRSRDRDRVPVLRDMRIGRVGAARERHGKRTSAAARRNEILDRRGEVGRTALKARVLIFDVEGIGGSGGQAWQSAEHQHERKMFHPEIPRSSSLDLP